jgi:DNA-binding SARP family transcriptional activator/tetratricopeptide (TPR) repeat protein
MAWVNDPNMDAITDGNLRIEVLGPIRACRDGKPLALGPPLRQAVLALLALRANGSVTRDEIIDAVWGENPPTSAVNNVHIYISGLRHLLEPARGTGVSNRVLIGGRFGYQLQLEPTELDLTEFEEHLRAATRLAGDGEPSSAVQRWDAALALWRGSPFAGVISPFVDAQRMRLCELRLAALEDRAEALLGLGRAAALVAQLSPLAAEHPLRERLRGLLMLALHRAGRRAEALRVYAETRRLLVDELGVEPGPELSGVHRAVLADIGPAATAPTGAAAPLAPPVIPRQLPPPIRQFAGRSAELASLTVLLDEMAGDGGTMVISAIDGMGGVGKTTLAVWWAHRVADRFLDGQLYVNLRGFDPVGDPMTPSAAIRGFLAALGVPPARTPPDLAAQIGLYRSLLAGRRMLVLLDNAADAEQVRPLLPGGSGCVTVVTSRNRLTSLAAREGAHRIVLDALARAEAVDLLARRLGAARVVAEPEAVHEIVARCAGLPLALSIVAARAATRPGASLAELAAELRPAGGLDALNAGDAASDIRAVFSWSYRVLSPSAARLFRLLGLHPGPDLGRAAAASLAGVPVSEIGAPLAELVHAHLLGELGRGRYALHDLLRAYAGEQACADDTRTDDSGGRALRRVLDHYLHTAHAASMLLYPQRDPIVLRRPDPGEVQVEFGDADEAMAWFTAEHAVLLSAVRCAVDARLDTHAWQLAWALSPFLDMQGHLNDWAATHETGLAAASRQRDRAGQALMSMSLGCAHIRWARFDLAHEHLTQALALYRELDDRLGRARTHGNLAWVAQSQGNPRHALRHAEQALALFETAGHRAGQAQALNGVGWFRAQVGDYRQALEYGQRAVKLLRELGHRGEEARAWDSLGYAHHRLGEYPHAIRCYQRAIVLARKTGDRWNEADDLHNLGDVQRDVGNPAAALAAWRRAVVIFDEMCHPDADTVRAKLAALRPAVQAG